MSVNGNLLRFQFRFPSSYTLLAQRQYTDVYHLQSKNIKNSNSTRTIFSLKKNGNIEARRGDPLSFNSEVGMNQSSPILQQLKYFLINHYDMIQSGLFGGQSATKRLDFCQVFNMQRLAWNDWKFTLPLGK